MRQIVLNELEQADREKVKSFLQKNVTGAGIDGIYWIVLPESLYAESQTGHEACAPFLFSVECGDDFVSFELLVRSQHNLHCSCAAYATDEQRQFLLNFCDRLVRETGVKA